jgi:uncharacterized protein (TIGR02757 family)
MGRNASSNRDARSPLKERLDSLYASYNSIDSATDPIHIVRRFDNPADREVVGFCSAALAFGRVASVLQSIERLLVLMGPSPSTFVREFEPRRQRTAFSGLVHRWTRGDDLVALVIVLQQMLRRGSIEAFFLEGYDPAAADIAGAVESFSERALAVDQTDAYGDRTCHPGVAYFFPRPSSGSGCKRMNLFLRWMVRKDAVDFGVWTNIPAAKLIIPLDTHVIRVGRCLRLTRYTSPGWKMAADITASLRQFDADDPVKYDFSLCHIGMADQCGFNREQGDSLCPLAGLCRPRLRGASPRTRGTLRASARPSARR